MHISEGVLNGPTLAAGAALAATGVAIGLKKIDNERLPQTALLASVFFVGSLIHVPIGPVSAHLILNGLCGLLLGWTAFPAIFMGLALQAVLFQYGGLTALGVNTFNMAFPAVVLGILLSSSAHSANPVARTVAVFVCGAGAVLFAGVLTAFSLLLTGEAFTLAAKTIVLAHIPVMVIEGILTVFVMEFLRKVKPEMLKAYSFR